MMWQRCSQQLWLLGDHLLVHCVVTLLILLLFLGSGSCRFSYSDPSITVSYSKNSSADWTQLEKIRFVTAF